MARKTYDPYANACQLVGPGHQTNRAELRAMKVGDLIDLAGYEVLPILEIGELRPLNNGRLCRDVLCGIPGWTVSRLIFDGPGSNFHFDAFKETCQ